MIASYTWDFGDGSAIVKEDVPQVGHVFSSAGTWRVTLTVETDRGQADTVGQAVLFSVAPRLTVDPSSPSIGQRVTFDGSSSESIGPIITAFEWNFGDGGAADGKFATHAYRTPGVYRVSLTLATSEGNPTVSTTIGVEPRASTLVSPYRAMASLSGALIVAMARKRPAEDA